MDDSAKRRDFGFRIRVRRLSMGISLTDLAKKLGISVKTAGNYESGYNWPSLPVYFRICRVLSKGRIPFDPGA